MEKNSLSLKQIFKTWWPLCASWLLMGFELPIINSALARLPDPEISLAAHGSVVAPLSWIIEAPIIMLLAASTALSKDWPSYVKIRRFMNWMSGILTVVHVLIAFTSLYYFVVGDIIGVPPEILEPARIDLMIMVPWTWAIAYRRFNQGVLIRFGHSGAIGVGTVIRLIMNTIVSFAGYSLGGTIPPTLIAGAAMTLGVISEAIYTAIRVQPVIRNELKPAPNSETPLTYPDFFRFYIPLALTSAIQLLFSPLASASMSRMPAVITSLAVWPVVNTAIFIFRSGGVAFNEVVVATLDRPDSVKKLRQFALILVVVFTSLTATLALSPLSTVWFNEIQGISQELTEIARLGLLVGILVPPLNVLTSLNQGALVNSKNTRGIPESVALSILTSIIIFAGGIALNSISGIYVSVAAMSGGYLVQTFWLWFRGRKVLTLYKDRDAVFEAV